MYKKENIIFNLHGKNIQSNTIMDVLLKFLIIFKQQSNIMLHTSTVENIALTES